MHRSSRLTGRQNSAQGARAAWSRPRLMVHWALVTLVILSAALAGCGMDANQDVARQNKARLETELSRAQNDLGIPASMLQPITTQQRKITDGEGGFGYNYADAAKNYQLLYTQLVSLEQTAAQQLQTQTDADIQAFTKALQQLRSQGFSEADAYQARLDQITQDFPNAKLPGEFARLDAVAQANTGALHALWPAYQKLQDYKAILRTLRGAGLNTALAQANYQQNLDVIRSAAAPERYQALTQIIDGQIIQLMADQVAATPYVGAALLDSFQARIDLLKSYGERTDTFQRQHDADARALTAATQLADYLKVGQAINKHIAGMTLPLIRGQARYDYAALVRLVDRASKIELTSKFDSTYKYPAAYEYMNAHLGVGDAKEMLDAAEAAGTAEQYQAADDVAVNLMTNLRAMLDNLNDPTPSSQPHATDLQLMRTYGIMRGKVVVIPLREQTLRAYENGKLVYWTYVTTGRLERPSWPGLHYVLYKERDTQFISPDPKGSPFWYPPTPINYAVAYAPNGFYIHDAWWRTQFGPDTNLPHWDPAAFNGGSHGCINVAENAMAWLFNWIPTGIPVIVY